RDDDAEGRLVAVRVGGEGLPCPALGPAGLDLGRVVARREGCWPLLGPRDGLHGTSPDGRRLAGKANGPVARSERTRLVPAVPPLFPAPRRGEALFVGRSAGRPAGGSTDPPGAGVPPRPRPGAAGGRRSRARAPAGALSPRPRLSG